MTSKACPACGSRMIDAPDAPGAWGCTSCGGVWAGISAANRAASILDPAVRQLADAAAQNAASTTSRARSAQVRSCPDCRAPLAPRELAAVSLDVCREHGTWFDRGELQRVAHERLGTKTANDDDPKSARWKPDTGTELAADLAIGAVALFFSILSD
ncbi:MAG: zf-TFIIB domain-containing protein [Labilithrix sp.]|nr:zf-TFIIB domain-containing protein [Labilithrix sp.]